jgi:hypothetical protein
MKSILENEIQLLNSINTNFQKSSIIYNIISLLAHENKVDEIYRYFKMFIDNYISEMKSNDFGYDTFNYEKIDKLLNLISYERQISILQYFISVAARELPEYERNWFLKRKHIAEIHFNLTTNFFFGLPNVVLLYFGLSLKHLLVGLVLIFMFTSIILLPVSNPKSALFFIEYESFTSNFVANHFLNILSIFSTNESKFKIVPLNGYGLILQLIGKLFFTVFIINFIYFKISDKITGK